MNKHASFRVLALGAAALLFFGTAALAQDNSQGGGPGGGAGRGRGQGQGHGQFGGGRGTGADLAPPPTAPSGPAKPIPPIAGEQFFIIASVDQARQELLLKRPTEVTMLTKTSDKTTLLDDMGRTLTLADFRAGDTVWVAGAGLTATATVPGEPTATRIRKGQMTVADLHRLYLDYAEIH
jgi:hypothetical protein